MSTAKEKDTMIRVSPDTRAKLKMKALKAGVTIKEFLKIIALKKE